MYCESLLFSNHKSIFVNVCLSLCLQVLAFVCKLTRAIYIESCIYTCYYIVSFIIRWPVQNTFPEPDLQALARIQGYLLQAYTPVSKRIIVLVCAFASWTHTHSLIVCFVWAHLSASSHTIPEVCMIMCIYICITNYDVQTAIIWLNPCLL